MKLFKKTGKSLYAFVLISRGAFHSTQSSGNFGWYIKWNGPFRFGLTGIFGTSFEGSPLWPDQPKCPFPFDKIVPPVPLICILLTRRITMGWVYATRMYRSIRHVNFPKFQASFFVEWKVPYVFNLWEATLNYKPCYYSFKIFPRFWLAKSKRLIHHNQLMMTKFGGILTLMRKWCQKCSVFTG